MSLLGQSLLDTQSCTTNEILALFEKARKIRSFFQNKSHSDLTGHGRPIVALVFLEPSTRTYLSFKMACERMGFGTVDFINSNSTSTSKGESLEDTLKNIESMQPDLMVIRHGDPGLDAVIKKLSVPVINAGSGRKSHPTQALLDAMTIEEARGQIKGENVLILGDILHGRVAQSNMELLPKLGANVAVCGPEHWVGAVEQVQKFTDIAEALEWADVVMALRIQRERHGTEDIVGGDDFHLKFGLNRDRIKKMKDDAIILHPGPVNRGVEITTDVIEDPRCQILQQVTNGVYLRAALMLEILDRDFL